MKNRLTFEEGGSNEPVWEFQTNRVILDEEDPRFNKRKRFRAFGLITLLLLLALIIGGGGYFYYTDRFPDGLNSTDQKLANVDLEGLRDSTYIPDENVSAELAKGISLYKNNDRKQAEREFENFINSAGSDHEKSIALVYLGIMALEKELYPLAKHHFIRALKYHPDYIPALVNLAITERRMGNLSDAKDYALRARELAPTDPKVSILLGNILSDSQDISGAIDAFKTGVDQNPSDPTLYYNLALSLLQKQNYEEAILYFSKAIELAGPSQIGVQSHAHLGQIYYARGNLEMAADHLYKAASMAPGNARYQYNLGVVYLRMGKPAEAATAFERALASDSDDIQVFRSLSQAFVDLNRPQLAVQALQKGLYRNPDDVAALFQLGDLYYSTKDLLSAAETYKKIVNITPGDNNTEDALLRLGRVYADLERYNDASAILEKLLSIKPNHVEGKYTLGYVYSKAGRIDLAVQVWKGVLGQGILNRDQERDVRMALASTYREQGAFDLAINEYRLIASRNKEAPTRDEDPALEMELGQTYFRLKDYQNALASFQKVNAFQSSTTTQRKQALQMTAIAQMETGNPADLEEARANAAKAVRLDPNDPELQITRAMALLKTDSLLDREKAIDLLTALTRSDLDAKTLSKAYNLLGLAYFKNAEYGRSLRSFDTSVDLDPSNREAYQNQRAAANAYENSIQR